jgi:TonB family protein
MTTRNWNPATLTVLLAIVLFGGGVILGQRLMFRRFGVQLRDVQAELFFDRIVQEREIKALLARGCITEAIGEISNHELVDRKTPFGFCARKTGQRHHRVHQRARLECLERTRLARGCFQEYVARVPKVRTSISFHPALLALALLCGCATRPTEISHIVVMTKVRPDPAHPVQLGENYPPESKLLHEEGECKVKLTVAADGAVRDVSLTKSTGYPRLDQACLEAFVHGGLLPATRDGQPSTTTLEIPITWKLAATPTQVAH